MSITFTITLHLSKTNTHTLRINEIPSQIYSRAAGVQWIESSAPDRRARV